MRSSEEADQRVCVCANCGIAEVDDEIKLKDCDGCDLVKYCGDNCKEAHREQHEEECKKRGQELHDNKLFKQPERSHRGECPICFLPMPLEAKKSTFYPCCSKSICVGCDYANYKSNDGDRCPFCREPATDKKENKKRVMKRIKANDPDAISQIGSERYEEGDYKSAVHYWKKAAELGDVDAHHNLSVVYRKGVDGEKDEEKGVYHLEKAAIGGHPLARHNLGAIEEENGNIERAVKHLIIAANLGSEESMKSLWDAFKEGCIAKEDLEATLRTHKSAIDAMKSPQREEAWRKRQLIVNK
jgi:TPR repeat protein